MQDFLARQYGADMNPPSCTLNDQPYCERSTQAVSEVSNSAAPASAAVLHDPISDRELVAHIAECRLLMRLAQARFRGSHSPQDAAEAAQWESAWHDAIKARQDAHRDADEATFAGDWTAEVLARRAG